MLVVYDVFLYASKPLLILIIQKRQVHNEGGGLVVNLVDGSLRDCGFDFKFR